MSSSPQLARALSLSQRKEKKRKEEESAELIMHACIHLQES
jgi:hypothetical protein